MEIFQKLKKWFQLRVQKTNETGTEVIYIKRPGIAGAIFLKIFEEYKSKAKLLRRENENQ